MVSLKNEAMLVEISEMGAEIKRICVDGKERLFDGNPAFWGYTAPVLFPICGGFENNEYIFKGTTYKIQRHGFARQSVFSLESCDESSAVFLLTENEETLKQYPFHFEFRVKYSLIDRSIKVTYEVTNPSNQVIYATFGAHEAYRCEGSIEDYDIIFEKTETLKSPVADENGVITTQTVLFKSDTLPLYYKYFTNMALDCLIFTELNSRFVTLRNRKSGEKMSVEFEGNDNLLIWSKDNAPYVCIEPWANRPRVDGDPVDIEKCENLFSVKPYESVERSHTAIF